MNITTAGILSASLVIGVGGAVAVFDAATSSEPRTAAVESPATVGDRGDRGDRPRFAPCRKPAKLVRGECVTDVTKTVVMPPARRDDQIYGRTRVLGDDADEVVDNDDDYDDDHGTRTRTRTRTGGQSVDTSTSTRTGHGDGGTSTRTRTGH